MYTVFSKHKAPLVLAEDCVHLWNIKELPKSWNFLFVTEIFIELQILYEFMGEFSLIAYGKG